MGKKVKQTIRLYKAHDLDLITFYETHQFNIIKAMYSALVSFSKKEHFVIEVPPQRLKQLNNVRRVYQKTLILDDEKDAEAINLLSKIAEGCRNNFLKNLLRLYLCNPISEEFLINKKDEDFFNDMFSVFRKGRRIASAGKLNKRNKQYEKKSAFNSLLEEKDKNNEKLVDKNERKMKEKNVAPIKDISEHYEENKNEGAYESSDYMSENGEYNDEDITDMFSQII